MKRLYTRVSVVDMPEGYALALDDRPVKTPGRWPLVLPARDLAEAVAEEWRTQGTSVRPETMPLMQLAATVLDHIIPKRREVEETTLRYAETDTVCYRADAPAELVRLQGVAWDPLLDWLESEHGVRLAVATGIVPQRQPEETLRALAALIAAMDPWRLCAFQSATASSGSFVIALALMEGRIDSDDAFRLAELDASFEIERWGEDGEATARRAVVSRDLAAARRFHILLGQ